VKKKDSKKINKARQRFEVHSGEGRRFDFSRLKQGFVFYVLLLLALVVIVQVGYHWLGEQFLAWRLQVVTAEQGIMEQKQEVEGLITRSEKVITAPDHGVILDLAKAGERVPHGKELARIGITAEPHFPGRDEEEAENSEDNEGDENSPGGDDFDPDDFETVITITGEEAGLLSYYIDGLENREGPFYIAAENLDEKVPEGSVTAKYDRVMAGDPLLKIVNNWEWHYNIVMPLHPGQAIVSEREVELDFAFTSEGPVRAELYHTEIDEGKNEVRLTYLLEKQLPGFAEVRRAEAVLYYAQQEGVIVPAEAVFEKNRQTGVFINRGGRVAFQPVTVTARQDDRAMVEGLEPRSQVITRHELVEEGRRLN